jgi:hypothetical protein
MTDRGAITTRCECWDHSCPVHLERLGCVNTATETLFRVDMQDESGTGFCEACGDDAFESGLFRNGGEYDV